MKKNLFFPAAVLVVVLAATGCQKGDLLSNPNAAPESSTVPVSLILNHITYGIYTGGGVVDGRPGAVNEIPWDLPAIWSQYVVSNYQYYRGNNFYNWSVSASDYDILRYAAKMEEQGVKQFGPAPTKYNALAKFFRAYAFVWMTQRVGDIPASQAGSATNFTPAYDPQHDVYKLALALLDSANTLMGSKITPATPGNAVFDAQGDVFGLTNLQWQKVINTYKLRVLISLSKRADDNADLNIKQQFATIVGNPAQYPIMTGNGDNMAFTYNSAFNTYPIFLRGNAPYNNFANIGKTYLDITTANHDPRTFAVATPAPAQLTGGKTVSDFTAYVGADISLDLGTLGTNAGNGKYSYANWQRYYSSSSGANAEPGIIIGYPEMCFNIAEAINRGWLTGASATWYVNGINASLKIYGLSQGQIFTVGDVGGSVIGPVTIDIAGFLANPNVVYAGDNATGLNQILQQKYVALFNNSGWEAFYNWRRTGVPTFSTGTTAISPSKTIPRRWQYPQDEVLYNGTNNANAVTSQFGGTDDLNKDLWLTK